MAKNTTPIDENHPAYTCLAYDRMTEDVELIVDLCQGTEHMRALGEKWLPREVNEKVKAYKNRLKRSFLYNAVQDTLNKHAAKPFSKPMSIRGDKELPERLKEIWGNVDRAGTDIDSFTKGLFLDAEKYGKTHIFVDYSRATGEETKLEEEQKRLRPFFIHVKARDVIGWDKYESENGETILTHVRWMETRKERRGQYGDAEVLYIRQVDAILALEDGVVKPVGSTWQLFRVADDGSYTSVGRGANTFPGIPLIPIYFNKTGFLEAKPPLKALAETNLEHFQSHSEHRNSLRFARIGILFGKGFSQEQVDAGITVGVNEAVLTTKPDADLKYVEVTGAAIEAGERDLAKLEERMEVLGLQPLIERANDPTATGAKINETKNMTLVQTWLRAIEVALYTAYEYAATWINEKLPDDFGVDIFSDFDVPGDPNENEFLLNACLNGKISDKLFLSEIQRRGSISPNVDLEEEIEEIKSQPPPPGGMTDNPNQRAGRAGQRKPAIGSGE